jgi:hypothetical protein
MLSLVAKDAELGELLMRTYILRRLLLIREGYGNAVLSMMLSEEHFLTGTTLSTRALALDPRTRNVFFTGDESPSVGRGIAIRKITRTLTGYPACIT